MSKKIIQLSTKQCLSCQALKKQIESVIDKISYDYEYISLYDGPDMSEQDFNIETYWDEVNKNIKFYTKRLIGFPPRGLPIVMIEENDSLRLINKEEIINILRNESK